MKNEPDLHCCGLETELLAWSMQIGPCRMGHACGSLSAMPKYPSLERHIISCHAAARSMQRLHRTRSTVARASHPWPMQNPAQCILPIASAKPCLLHHECRHPKTMLLSAPLDGRDEYTYTHVTLVAQGPPSRPAAISCMTGWDSTTQLYGVTHTISARDSARCYLPPSLLWHLPAVGAALLFPPSQLLAALT